MSMRIFVLGGTARRVFPQQFLKVYSGYFSPPSIDFKKPHEADRKRLREGQIGTRVEGDGMCLLCLACSRTRLAPGF